jgi:hypothetical protein
MYDREIKNKKEKNLIIFYNQVKQEKNRT